MYIHSSYCIITVNFAGPSYSGQESCASTSAESGLLRNPPVCLCESLYHFLLLSSVTVGLWMTIAYIPSVLGTHVLYMWLQVWETKHELADFEKKTGGVSAQLAVLLSGRACLLHCNQLSQLWEQAQPAVAACTTGGCSAHSCSAQTSACPHHRNTTY